MPIVRLLEYEAFSPEDISVITDAFESAVSVLRLTDRDDTETVERASPGKSLSVLRLVSAILFAYGVTPSKHYKRPGVR